MNDNKYDLAKIYYQKLDDNTVKIENFENFMSRYDILKKYGYSVLRDYLKKSETVCLIDKGKETAYLNINTNNNNMEFIGRGKELYIDEFNTIMSAIKRAGYNLVSSIKKYQNKFVEVEI